MLNNLMNELKEFLKKLDLSNYEINAYMVLLQSNNLTAREISSKSKVPSGRIYEVLDKLKAKEMIEIHESRPKKYSALSINKVFNKLISNLSYENQKKISFLIDNAKKLESDLYNSKILVKTEPTKIFWSTALGPPSIQSLFIKHIDELQEELLVNIFISKITMKILPHGKKLYEAIINAINRGVNVKILWSFDHDKRPLSEEQKNQNLEFYSRLVNKHKELYNLSSKMKGLEMKFLHEKIPTYYNILDQKRIIIILQHPIKPYKAFGCMNVLDPNFAKELRKKFLNVWLYEALTININ